MKVVEDNKDLGWEWGERELFEQLFLVKKMDQTAMTWWDVVEGFWYLPRQLRRWIWWEKNGRKWTKWSHEEKERMKKGNWRKLLNICIWLFLEKHTRKKLLNICIWLFFLFWNFILFYFNYLFYFGDTWLRKRLKFD